MYKKKRKLQGNTVSIIFICRGPGTSARAITSPSSGELFTRIDDFFEMLQGDAMHFAILHRGRERSFASSSIPHIEDEMRGVKRRTVHAGTMSVYTRKNQPRRNYRMARNTSDMRARACSQLSSMSGQVFIRGTDRLSSEDSGIRLTHALFPSACVNRIPATQVAVNKGSI